MNIASLTAIFTLLNQTIASTAQLVTAVIQSQPDEVKKTLWERHVTLTQPLYDLLAKVAAKIDAAIEGK